jgi:hypothetical protein
MCAPPKPPEDRRVTTNIEHPPFDFHGAAAPAVALEPRQAAGEGAEGLDQRYPLDRHISVVLLAHLAADPGAVTPTTRGPRP